LARARQLRNRQLAGRNVGQEVEHVFERLLFVRMRRGEHEDFGVELLESGLEFLLVIDPEREFASLAEVCGELGQWSEILADLEQTGVGLLRRRQAALAWPRQEDRQAGRAPDLTERAVT
jgi:hypothetical protein